MVEKLISALLPVMVTLLIGYYAGIRKDFSNTQAENINKIVMNYTLPMSLFGGILANSRSEIFKNFNVALWVFGAMIGGYFLVLIIARFILQENISIAVLRSLAIASPAIPFVGPTVLGSLFPSESSLLIAIGGIVVNVFQVPISVILLTSSSKKENVSIFQNLVTAFKKPVVWAPILAFILTLLGIKISPSWEKSFTTLGSATGGLALFSSGIMLFSRRFDFELPVIIDTFFRNIFFPAVMFAIMFLFKADRSTMNMSLVVLGIPAGSITTILASQYHILEGEMSSTLFLSTVFSMFSLGAIIIMCNI